MATIYEITADLQAIADMMDDPELDPQVLQDTMEALKAGEQLDFAHLEQGESLRIK